MVTYRSPMVSSPTRFTIAMMTVVIAALIAAFLAARPAVHLWELVAALALAAMLAAETVVHGLMLRSHREEVRELRARLPM